VETVYSVPWVPRCQAREEEPWVPAARRGECWALERFYESYQAQVFGLCLRMLGRPEDARDAVQMTFVKAFRELPRFRGDSAIRTWVYRIAVNEAVGMLRRRRDGAELDEGLAQDTDEAGTVIEQLAVRAAMRKMSSGYRTILVLRFWEGLSCSEIAHVLRISEAAVKMRLHRARDEFRRCYEGAV
jgi:RNA polymerase sigma-70 factor (ECF subfamily)